MVRRGACGLGQRPDGTNAALVNVALATGNVGRPGGGCVRMVVDADAKGDRHVYASRTRFIQDGLLGLFDQSSWPAVAAGVPPRTGTQGVSINVGDRMRVMWR